MLIDRERYEREFHCFKQLCSPVAAITGPWNCILYRDILLLKAYSCSRRFSSNCVADAAPKHSSGCGFMLTNLRHNSARGSFCAMRTSSKENNLDEVMRIILITS